MLFGTNGVSEFSNLAAPFFVFDSSRTTASVSTIGATTRRPCRGPNLPPRCAVPRLYENAIVAMTLPGGTNQTRHCFGVVESDDLGFWSRHKLRGRGFPRDHMFAANQKGIYSFVGWFYEG